MNQKYNKLLNHLLYSIENKEEINGIISKNKITKDDFYDKIQNADKPDDFLNRYKNQDLPKIFKEIQDELNKNVIGFEEGKKLLYNSLLNKINGMESKFCSVTFLTKLHNGVNFLIEEFLKLVNIPYVVYDCKITEFIDGNKYKIGKFAKMLLQLNCNNGIVFLKNVVTQPVQTFIHRLYTNIFYDVKYIKYRFDISNIMFIITQPTVDQQTLQMHGIDISKKLISSKLYREIPWNFLDLSEINEKNAFEVLKLKIIPDILLKFDLSNYTFSDCLIKSIIKIFPNDTFLAYTNIIKNFISCFKYSLLFNNEIKNDNIDVIYDVNQPKILTDDDFKKYGNKDHIYPSHMTYGMYT